MLITACGTSQPVASPPATTTPGKVLPVPAGSFDDVRDIDACAILDPHLLGTLGTVVATAVSPLVGCSATLRMPDLPVPMQITSGMSAQDPNQANGSQLSLGDGVTVSTSSDCATDYRTYTMPLADNVTLWLSISGGIEMPGEGEPSAAAAQPFCAAARHIVTTLAPDLRDLPRYPDDAVPKVDPCVPLSRFAAGLVGATVINRNRGDVWGYPDRPR